MDLAKRLDRIEVPQTIQMAKMARALTAEGKDVINLSLGEPDFPTPKHIIDAAYNAMLEGHTKYTPVSGTMEIKNAICEKLKRDNNLSYSPEEIIVCTGAKQAIANAVLCLINPGDEVIVPSPYWVTYKGLVDLSEGITLEVHCPAEQGFKITAAQLEAAITPKTKLFIFSSPCNPTGAVYSKEELKELVDVFVKYPSVNIISDEIYEYINFEGKHESIAQFEEIRQQVIVVNGLSKGFAMTGWRLGYLAGPKDLVAACDELQGQITSGTNSVTQRATITALLGDLQPSWDMRDEFQKRRDYVVSELKSIPGIKLETPPGAFYVFPDISAFFGKHDIKTSLDFSLYLLNTIFVSTVAGEAFGDKNCIRISYAASMEQLQEAMSRIKKLLYAY
jgi:aspartate aminotransferase